MPGPNREVRGTPWDVLARSGLLVMGLLLTGPAAGSAQQPWQRQGAPPAWLGIGYEISWIQRAGSCESRVWIERVVQGSPADRAGLRVGDAIIALDDEPLAGARLEALAARLHPGDSVRFRVSRNGQVRQLTAVADLRPARPPAAVMAPSAGGFMATSSAPLIHVDGETLVARNVESGPRVVSGYWLATDDGHGEYRRLGSWSRDDLDERVLGLLRCAAEVGTPEAIAPRMARRIDLQQLQQRADSLRVMITRRALEASEAASALNALSEPAPPRSPRPAPHPQPGSERSGTAPELPGSPSIYILRTEDRLAAGLREVAGAELTVLEPELAAYFRNVREGLLVLRVAPGSDAERSGLRPGDVIVEGDRRDVDSPAQLRALLARPGPHAVQLRVVRKGRSQLLSLPRPGR